MCLIFISVNQHQRYKLVVAANRDEFYNRKTQAAHFWNDDNNVLAGRDLEAGGTWLGMNRHGKVSMITNYRDPRNIRAMAPSRGHLVSAFLRNSEEGKDYLATIANPHFYNGFNLIAGSVDRLHYFSNYREGITEMKTGLFGLSNHLLDTPWPKVYSGKKQMAEILAKEDFTTKDLFTLLSSETVAPDNMLPDTGVGIERERALSAMFIKTPGYGTRCSTVILVDKDNRVEFVERVYDLQTFDFSEQTFHFTISD